LTARAASFIETAMTETEIQEDRLIRRLLIVVPTFLVAGFLVTMAVVAALVSDNFNVMNWLE
jgi:hypothetical protein